MSSDPYSRQAGQVRDNHVPEPNVEAMVDVDALRDDPVYFWLMITFVSFVVAEVLEEL